jgi:large subunit ribosomal protein L30
MRGRKKCIAVIRVRGTSDIFHEVKDTLKMLHITRNHNAILIDDRASYLGMLQKAQSYVTWGEVSKESIMLLLKKRGKLLGNKRITIEYTNKIGYKTFNDLAEAIYNLKVEYNCLPSIKPMFRLHPPKKGFKGKIKKSYTAGGVFGYRGEAINDLIKKMV